MVLPLPAAPTTTRVSPGFIEKETWSSARVSPKDRQTFSNCTAGLDCACGRGIAAAGKAAEPSGKSLGVMGFHKFTNNGSSMEVITNIHTDETTTALVVERPTPCVPPEVVKP